jgi:hypothetical protein
MVKFTKSKQQKNMSSQTLKRIVGKLVRTNYEYVFLHENVPFASTQKDSDLSYSLSKLECEKLIDKFLINVLWKSNIKHIPNKRLDYTSVLYVGFVLGATKMKESYTFNNFTRNQLNIAIQFAKENPELSSYDIIEKIQEFEKFQTAVELVVEVEMEYEDNQCDGCNEDAELDINMHLDKITKKPFMTCQKAKYQHPKFDKEGNIILKTLIQ